jgi:hypothetical protein
MAQREGLPKWRKVRKGRKRLVLNLELRKSGDGRKRWILNLDFGIWNS